MASDDTILEQARKRYDVATLGWQHVYDEALSDLRFVYDVDGGQWPDDIRADRIGRPMITDNKLLKFVRQLGGESRQNRPRMKVIPVDNFADTQTADIYNGLIRQIEYLSSAEVAYDTAYRNSVSSSVGFWRLITKYENEFSFNQDIFVKRIANALSVKYDPAPKEFDLSDANYCFIDEWMTKKEFEAEYPDATVYDFQQNARGQNYAGWFEKDKVLVSEYYYKEKKKIKIGLIQKTTKDGELLTDVEELTPALKERLNTDSKLRLLRERDSETIQVKWKKITGAEVLEETDWPGKYIPVIPVFGDEVIVNGKRHLLSFIRGAKGPQQMHNYWSSAATEVVALTPKNPFIVTAKQVSGYENQWQEANRANRAVLYYNNLPGLAKPARERPADMPTAMVGMMQNASFELEDYLGRYESSKGAPSNERSGRAILARVAQSDKGTFTFVDNFSRAIIYSARQIIDLIPKIYDTQRALRIRGEDETEELTTVNENTGQFGADGRPVVKNDLTVGKYDLIATVGASYSSKRQEALDMMIQSMQYAPQIAPIIAPLIFKYSDWPGADEISAELKKAIEQSQQAQAAGGQPNQPGGL